ncbi:IclR family transcriptional regulator [Haloarchaeobius sp. DYHT-AS-18]|uniref:IclR family transcriptional regulator n=1 Tax=Haloarchaeobius sp. DYHT-AS-18 TaxID=3446117 RepID=UPI003EBD40DB
MDRTDATGGSNATARTHEGSSDMRIKSVEKALEIVEALRVLDEPTTANIASRLDYSKSSVYKHLTTLEHSGYVVRTGDLYRPSHRFFEIGNEVNQRWVDMYDPAKSALEELADETGENTWLMVEERGEGVMICNVQGEKALEPGYFYEGKRAQLHSSAAGKAILANLPEHRRETLIEQVEFEQFTDKTIIYNEELREELATVRETGIAINDEETQTNIRALGAPIFDEDGVVIGSISVSGPTSRISDEYYQEDLPRMLREKTDIIEIQMVSR